MKNLTVNEKYVMDFLRKVIKDTRDGNLKWHMEELDDRDSGEPFHCFSYWAEIGEDTKLNFANILENAERVYGSMENLSVWISDKNERDMHVCDKFKDPHLAEALESLNFLLEDIFLPTTLDAEARMLINAYMTKEILK